MLFSKASYRHMLEAVTPKENEISKLKAVACRQADFGIVIVNHRFSVLNCPIRHSELQCNRAHLIFMSLNSE